MKLETLLRRAVEENASDIHLTSGALPAYRIDGDLRFFGEKVLDPKNVESIILHILNDIQYEQFKAKNEVDCSFQLQNPTVRFRVNAYHEHQGPAISIRIIKQLVPTPSELNFPNIIENLCHLHHGLILVTGPTGSGKSTTVAAMINYINQTMSKHIISIEDPIEFIYHSDKCLINQRQISRDTHDFKGATRAAMRQDPDIIFLGEMRDLETIRQALIAAETGHLVLGTLHTPSAHTAITRIVDVFDSAEKELIRIMLADTLQAVIAQTLIKKIGGGRTAALEIMLCNSAVKNLIRTNKIPQIYSAMQAGKHIGMCTMDQSIEQLEQAGIIKPLNPKDTFTF